MNEYKDPLERERNLKKLHGCYMQKNIDKYATEYTDISQESGMPRQFLSVFPRGALFLFAEANNEQKI
jgi:hypothetical protein